MLTPIKIKRERGYKNTPDKEGIETAPIRSTERNKRVNVTKTPLIKKGLRHLSL